MEIAGLYFDEICSSLTDIRFTGELGNVSYFYDWIEVEEWLRNCVFDDPDVQNGVDKILAEIDEAEK